MMKITFEQECIANSVLKHGRKIADVANDFGISKSTVRRAMDKFTDESLRVKRDETIDKAYLISIELHVGNDTRHLTRLFFADSLEEAKKVMDTERPNYRGNENPSYQLQVKGGPFKLTENLHMMEEY